MRFLILLTIAFACQTVMAQFTTVINVPPNIAPSSVPSGTQVNVFEGGAFGGRFNRALSGSEVNFLGGGSGLAFLAQSGSIVNVEDGNIGFLFTAADGSMINITGGQFDHSLTAESGSNMNISGGFFSSQNEFAAGSNVTMRGGDFRIDDQLITGLNQIGDQTALNLTNGSVFSGVLEDGSTFAFTTLDNDTFAGNAVTLERTAIPQATPGSIVASVDGVPKGLRAGEELIVDDGSIVPSKFTVLSGGSLRVEAGGKVRNELEVVDGFVRAEGGEIESGLQLFGNSVMEVAGGVAGGIGVYDGASLEVFSGSTSSINLRAGSIANVHGGSTGIFYTTAGSSLSFRGGNPGIDAEAGSDLQFFGSDFRINGVPVDMSGTNDNGIAVDVPLNSYLSGILPSGEPFVIAHEQYLQLPPGTVRLFPESVPTAEPKTIVTSLAGPVQMARAGQKIIVDSTLGMPGNSTAAYAESIQVVANGSIAGGFKAIGTSVMVDGGHIGGSFDIFDGTTLVLNYGSVSINGDAYSGSKIVMRGGELGSRLDIHAGAEAHFSGGVIGGFGAGGEVVITGGEIGSSIDVWNTGSLTIAGGIFPEDTWTTPDFDVSAGGQVSFIGSDFSIGGQSIGLNYGVPYLVTARSGHLLEGTLQDGMDFELKLEDRSDPACCTRPNGIDSDAILTITYIIAGDVNVDGSVDEQDFAAWQSNFGQGSGGDADFDGDTDGADLLVMQRNFGRVATFLSNLETVPEPQSLSLFAFALLLCQGLVREQ